MRFAQIDVASPERAAGVLAAARRAGLSVIDVIIHFRPGYPEVPVWGLFYGRTSGMLRERTEGAAIH